MINAAETPHISLAVRLMLSTAGRISAILELTWDRVDFDAGVIDLKTDQNHRKGRATVPMNNTLRAALDVAARAALSDYVVEYAGGPIKSIRKGFQSSVDRAGLSNVTLHTLRHTAAVHMAAAGIPITKISQFLGHSNSIITERAYARFAPDHLRDAAEVLEFNRFKKGA